MENVFPMSHGNKSVDELLRIVDECFSVVHDMRDDDCVRHHKNKWVGFGALTCPRHGDR